MARLATAIATVALSGFAAATEYEYKISSRTYTFPNAQKWCDSGSGFRGQLVSITSQAEWDKIHDLFTSTNPNTLSDYWLGLTRVSSNPHTWVYDDGENVIESFNGQSVWKSGEPNNYRQREHCVAVGRNSMKWNDANCDGNRKQHAICKRQQVQNPYSHEGWSSFSPPGVGASTTCYYKYFNRVMMKELSEYSRRSWFDAEGFCQSELLGNAHLVSIESGQENDFVKDLLYTQNMEFENRPVWIGGHKVDDSWKWSDGAAFAHTNWIEGEPDEGVDFVHQDIKNEHCAQFSHSRVGNGFARTKQGSKISLGKVGEWNNADCQMKRGWICEYCTDQF